MHPEVLFFCAKRIIFGRGSYGDLFTVHVCLPRLHLMIGRYNYNILGRAWHFARFALDCCQECRKSSIAVAFRVVKRLRSDSACSRDQVFRWVRNIFQR